MRGAVRALWFLITILSNMTTEYTTINNYFTTKKSGEHNVTTQTPSFLSQVSQPPWFLPLDAFD